MGRDQALEETWHMKLPSCELVSTSGLKEAPMLGRREGIQIDSDPVPWHHPLCVESLTWELYAQCSPSCVLPLFL